MRFLAQSWGRSRTKICLTRIRFGGHLRRLTDGSTFYPTSTGPALPSAPSLITLSPTRRVPVQAVESPVPVGVFEPQSPLDALACFPILSRVIHQQHHTRRRWNPTKNCNRWQMQYPNCLTSLSLLPLGRQDITRPPVPNLALVGFALGCRSMADRCIR